MIILVLRLSCIIGTHAQLIMPETINDTILITVPPHQRMLKVVRLTTAAAASQSGLNLDQADDLNTALDELFRLSLSQTDSKHNFCLQYVICPDRLEVLVKDINASIVDKTSKVGRYRRFIIDKVVDRFEERAKTNGGFDILLVKYMSD